MKTSFAGKPLLFLLVFLLTAGVCLSGLAESYTASTMRLLHYEGTVEIEDASGKNRFVMENVRFSSGEAMRTGENSTASVSLDDSKILTLDAESRVEFIKQNNAMKLTLTQGALLLDVQKKLDENETLDIQTSTMSVGIRGTIVYVEEHPGENGQKAHTTLGVLEGTAQVTYQDAGNTARSLPVPAGFELSITKDATGAELETGAAARVETVRLKEDALPEFVQRTLNADPALEERTAPALGDSFPADGPWVWTGTITLVAQSASKLYDGLPLSRSSDVLVYGLPEFFSIRVSASGSQTNVGSSANVISGFAILNNMGEDVTSHFPSVETIPGQLVVSPAPLTVWTGSAEKTYDGEPLTNPEARLMTVSGYEEDMPSWQNASFVAPGDSGGQVMYALNGSTWVHGTNPLTGETREIELRAGQKMTVRLSDDQSGSSIELLIENITEEEIPDEILRLYADNPELLSAACAETGWNRALIENRIAQLPPAEQTAAEWNGLRTGQRTASGLIRNSADVRITIDTDITSYNGRVLGSQEARITQVQIDESITVTATGSQTEVGESPNTYTIDWGSADPGNYILSEELGTLKVLEPTQQAYTDPVRFTAASAEKVYDGAPLQDAAVTVTGLPAGFHGEALAAGSQREAGSSENRVVQFAILNNFGEDVTDQFSNITLENGTLTVKPLLLGYELTDQTEKYAGSIVVPEILLIYQNGVHAGETIPGSDMSAGAGQALSAPSPALQRVYSLFTGDQVILSITGAGTDAGTYTLTGSFTFPGSIASNFDLPIITCEYAIEPVQLLIATASASKTYDGEALTANEASVTGLLPKDIVTVSASASITEVGTAQNAYTIDWGETNPDNYLITEALGVLTITPNDTEITFTAASDEKAYDGTALKNASVSVSGLPEGFSFTAAALGSQRGAGQSENTVSAYAILKDGRDVTIFFTGIRTVSGTLTVTPAPLLIETGSASKPYDGTALACGDVSVLGLAEGENVTVTATGSITEVGTAENAFVIDWGNVSPDNYTISQRLGVLEITENGAAIVFTAGSAEKVYDGTPLACEEVTVSGLPAGFTFEAAAAGSQTQAGVGTNAVISWAIYQDGRDVSDHFPAVVTVPGTLTVSPAEITVTTGSALKPYDGTALTCGEASVLGLAAGETVTVTATGTITDVGTAVNTYRIDWGKTNPANYTVAESLGTLEVTGNGSAAVVFTAGSAEKAYDGAPLTCGQVTVSGLPSQFSFEALASGSQTQAGESENAVVSYAILLDGADVTDRFSSITTVKGTLTVTPAAVTVTTASAAKAYDGTPLTRNEASITGLVNGETAAVAATGSITDIGTAVNTYLIDWGDTDPANYTIAENLGTLEVTANTAEITFTAASASKVYDGTALTDTFVTVSGLPAGFTYEVTVTGSQTDVGESDNVVSSYKIFNAESADVTDSFTSIATVNGKLTVTPAEVSITTGSASKAYDGTPLQRNEASISGLVTGETATVTATGSITEIGTAQNTYSIEWGTAKESNYTVSENLGTLEVTANAAEITFTAASASKVYDGTALTDTFVTVSGLPAGFTYEVTVTGSQTDVGESDNVVSSYKIFNAESADVTDSFTSIATVNGKLTVTPAEVSITTGSASKAYDGTPLQRNEASISGLVTGETATVTATGSITEIGTAQNTYSIEWGTAKESNYTVSENLGTLEVTANTAEITFTAASASKVYDGTALTDTFVTVSGLPAGFTYEVTVTGSQTDVGESDNVVSSYKIFNAESADVTDSFTSIATVNGKLTVTPAEVSITTGSASKAYDGTPLKRNEASISGLVSGETVTVTATGSITEIGTAQNTYSIEWGTAKESNYTVSENLGTLEVTANTAEITFTAASASKVYDGTALTDTFVTVSGLPAGFTYEVTVTGSQTDVGESDNVVSSYKIFNAESADVTDSFTSIATVNGKLTVTPAEVSITTGSASKAYDGTPLQRNEASISGLVSGETVTVTATGSITEIGTAQNTYSIEWGTAKESNYTVSENLGTLEITPNDAKIIITSGSSSASYTPFGLVNSDYTVEGLPEGFTAEVTVTGSLSKAGSGSNTISGYTIYKDSEDKTACFTNIELVEGTLTLTKAKINVWSKDETFPYKGSSYSPSVQWQGVYAADGPMATDLSITDKEWVKDAGTHNPTFTATLIRSDLLENYEIGTLTFGTITITPAELAISTGSASKPYDGAPLTCADVTIDGLQGLDEITVACTGSITEMGTAENTYTIDWGTVNSANYTVTDTLGTLEVTEPLTVTLTAASAEKAYDGTALENSAVTAEGLPAGYTFEASASGTQTNAGSSPNRVNDGYIIRNAANEDVTGTFTVTKVDGTLTVTPMEVTVAIADSVFTYDNAYHYVELSVSCAAETVGALQGDSAYRLQLPDAQFMLTFSDASRRKEAGSWDLSFSGISWDYGTQSNYNVITIPGSLTINKRPVTVRTGSAEKVYDGTPLVNAEATVENGITGLTATATGTITDAGSIENTYTLSMDEWYTANLEITEELGTLTVKPAPITIQTGDEEKVFDGAPLPENTDAPIVIGTFFEPVTLSPKYGVITDAGTANNEYEIDWGSANPDNYAITEELGDLTVTPLEVYIDLGGYNYWEGDYSWEYDGTFHRPDVSFSSMNESFSSTYDSVHFSDFTLSWPWGDEILVHVEGAWKDAGSHSFTYSISMNAGRRENYAFSVTGSTVTIKPHTIYFDLGGTPAVTYDGNYHSGMLDAISALVDHVDYSGDDTEAKVYVCGDIIDTKITGGGTEPGKYQMDCSYSCATGSIDNYNIFIQNDELVIEDGGMIAPE